MSLNNVKELIIDSFCLKATIIGNGDSAIVIGSHKYYQRTFSENLRNNLQLIFIDTRAFTPDNPSHTDSDFTLDKIVQDIEIMRKLLKLDKFIIIGHSIHAFIAIEYTRRYPDTVKNLVLIATSPIAGPEIYKESDRYFEESVCPKRKSVFAKKIASFQKSKDQSFIARMKAFGSWLWYDYNFDAAHLWTSVEINNKGAEIIWGTMFVNYDIDVALRNIDCSVFLALGRYDYFNPPHLWEKYRNYFKDLVIRVFERSSHTPQLEESLEFDKELINWISTRKQ